MPVERDDPAHLQRMADMARAAEHMRSAHGPDHERHHMWEAMATMLDRHSWMWWMVPETYHRVGGPEVYEVAAAYLEAIDGKVEAGLSNK